MRWVVCMRRWSGPCGEVYLAECTRGIYSLIGKRQIHPLRVKPQDPKLPLTFSHVDHRLWILRDFHIALTFPERHRLVEGSSDPMTSSALETATCRIIFQYWVVMLIPPSFDLLCLGKRQEERGGVGARWRLLASIETERQQRALLHEWIKASVRDSQRNRPSAVLMLRGDKWAGGHVL